MNFSWIDLLIALSVFGYVWGGLWTGLIQAVGGIVGLFVGSLVASRSYEKFGEVLKPVFAGNGLLADIFAFILLFLIVTRAIGLIFYVVNRMFNFIAIIPGLKMLNRLGGGLFGFLEGALFVGITLQFMSHLPLPPGLAREIAESRLADYFLNLTAWMVPLFPSALREAENVVDRFIPR